MLFKFLKISYVPIKQNVVNDTLISVYVAIVKFELNCFCKLANRKTNKKIKNLIKYNIKKESYGVQTFAL